MILVTFETKVYKENNNQFIGAEVIVYSDSGKNIDKIYITNKTDYDALVNRLNNLDENYITQNDLDNYISNIDFNSRISGKADKTSVPNLEDIRFVSKNKDSSGSIIIGYLE